VWYNIRAYIADRKKMEPMIPYKNIREEPRGGGDSPSCIKIEEPNRRVEKRIRKSINHFSFFLNSTSGICIAFTIVVLATVMTAGQLAADESLILFRRLKNRTGMSYKRKIFQW
jgi:hypothetical protein